MLGLFRAGYHVFGLRLDYRVFRTMGHCPFDTGWCLNRTNLRVKEMA